MIDKLKSAELRYEEISLKLTEPDIVSNNELYKSLMKEYKELTPLVEKYREYIEAKQAGEEAAELLEEPDLDDELKVMANDQLADSKAASSFMRAIRSKALARQSKNSLLSDTR